MNNGPKGKIPSPEAKQGKARRALERRIKQPEAKPVEHRQHLPRQGGGRATLADVWPTKPQA